MNRIEIQCRAKGIRMTGPRRVIAEVLSRSDDHPDALELHRRVAARQRGISLATVYRTVKILQSEGIIERHSFQDGPARYERTSRKHHDHLIDVDTGAVIEFTNPEIEALQRAIAQHLGYELVGHKLELHGRRIGAPRG